MKTTLIPHGTGMAWHLAAGKSLRIVDVEGGQTGDVFVVAADDFTDSLSNGRSFDIAASLRLSTGSVLYSRSSRPLLTITADEVGTHDFLYAPCSRCFAGLTGSFAAFDVPATVVTTAFNVFMRVAIGPDWSIAIEPPLSTAGQGITFSAERDVIVAVTACAAPSANTGTGKPLLAELQG